MVWVSGREDQPRKGRPRSGAMGRWGWKAGRQGPSDEAEVEGRRACSFCVRLCCPRRRFEAALRRPFGRNECSESRGLSSSEHAGASEREERQETFRGRPARMSSRATERAGYPPWKSQIVERAVRCGRREFERVQPRGSAPSSSWANFLGGKGDDQDPACLLPKDEVASPRTRFGRSQGSSQGRRGSPRGPQGGVGTLV
jgi:hypothetical protein